MPCNSSVLDKLARGKCEMHFYPCALSMMVRKLRNFPSRCEASRLEPNSATTKARARSAAQYGNTFLTLWQMAVIRTVLTIKLQLVAREHT